MNKTMQKPGSYIAQTKVITKQKDRQIL